jgi:hypothetical protein
MPLPASRYARNARLIFPDFVTPAGVRLELPA